PEFLHIWRFFTSPAPYTGLTTGAVRSKQKTLPIFYTAYLRLQTRLSRITLSVDNGFNPKNNAGKFNKFMDTPDYPIVHDKHRGHSTSESFLCQTFVATSTKAAAAFRV